MEKILCGINRCPNKVKYHHILEECYYCKGCALSLFKKNECTKIGSISEIQYLLTLCKNLWEEVEEYVSKEKLALKWKHELEAHKVFKVEIDSIEDGLKETLDNKRLSNLANIEIKISDLKSNPIKIILFIYCVFKIYKILYKHNSNKILIINFNNVFKSKITDSDIFCKYLKHKKLTKHLIKEKIEKKELVTQIVCDLAEVRAEEEKVMLRDKYQKWRHQLEPKTLINPELEELKQQHLAEIDEIKRKGEKELNELKNQPKDLIDGTSEISYDALLIKNNIKNIK